MTKTRPTRTSKAEIERLRIRLAEAEETLQAIRSGEVDAIAVDGPHGRQLFTLQSADQPYRVLAERMSEGAASMTADGTILFCNQRLAEMVGRAPATMVGLSAIMLVPPESKKEFQEFLASGLIGEARRELQFQRSDGSAIPVFASLAAIPGEPEPRLGLIAMDFSEHRQAEEKIRLQASQYAALLATTSDGYWRFDRRGRLLDVNDVYCQMSGYSRTELLKLCIADIEASEEPREALRHIEKIVSAGFDRFASKHRKKNGEIFDVEISATYFAATNQFILFVRDTTARKQTEDKLRQQAALLDLAHDAIIVRDLDSHILFWSRGATDTYGFSVDEALGRTVHELLQTVFPASLEAITRSIQGSREWEGELHHTRKDGCAIVVSSRWSLLRNERGQPVAIMEINRDVTEQKQANEVVRKASHYTRSLIEASLDPLVTISREGKITDVNEATEKVTGVPRQRLVGTDFSNYFTQPAMARRGYRQAFAHGSVTDYPLALRHVSGKLTEVLYNASVFKNEAGDVEGVFAAARDVTERKRAEAEVHKLNQELEQRVAARTEELRFLNKELEAFNYAVAHDLRAPLRHIHGFAEMLAEEARPVLTDSSQHQLDIILDSVQHMNQLLEDLLKLSRLGRQELCKQVCSANGLIAEVVQSLEPESKGRQVEWRIADLSPVECDPNLFKQVLVNLLSNALKFTRTRSPAIIEIGQTTIDGQAVIFIRDNGVGFSMKYADKLFGLFQRLHRQQDFEGTGVGLAIVQRIMHRHGGRAWGEAELDEGATFYLSLGSCEAAGKELAAAHAAR